MRAVRASAWPSQRPAPHALRESLPQGVACRVLAQAAMATKSDRPSEAWTVPLHVVMWTTMMVGFIMVFVVFLMH